MVKLNLPRKKMGLKSLRQKLAMLLRKLHLLPSQRPKKLRKSEVNVPSAKKGFDIEKYTNHKPLV